jgi:hypothetical protein
VREAPEERRAANPRGKISRDRKRVLRGYFTDHFEGARKMAMRVETNPMEAAYAALLSQGLDGAGEALRILVNEASKIERAHYLNAQPFERCDERQG